MSGKSGSDGLSGLTIAQDREYLVRTVDAGRLMGDPGILWFALLTRGD
jgi:hypothetical protein